MASTSAPPGSGPTYSRPLHDWSTNSAAEAASPVYVAARRLCALNDLTLSSLTAGFHTGLPDTVSWGVMTSNGVFYMLIGPNQAQLADSKVKILGTVLVNT
jgi:hypothetical protein